MSMDTAMSHVFMSSTRTREANDRSLVITRVTRTAIKSQFSASDDLFRSDVALSRYLDGPTRTSVDYRMDTILSYLSCRLPLSTLLNKPLAASQPVKKDRAGYPSVSLP